MLVDDPVQAEYGFNGIQGFYGIVAVCVGFIYHPPDPIKDQFLWMGRAWRFSPTSYCIFCFFGTFLRLSYAVNDCC